MPLCGVALKNWGADTETALNRFMGDEDLYIECLDMIVDDEHFAGLAKTITDGEYKQAFEHAHCLKGVSGNLGLTPLFEALCALVEPLRNEKYENLEDKLAVIETKHAEYNDIMK